jgi:methyl-accepting chemotaxis protein
MNCEIHFFHPFSRERNPMHQATPSQPIRSQRTKGIGIGSKILIGVALASNLFIGMLLYDHLRSSETLAGRVSALLLVKEQLNDNLRQAVAGLQNDLLRIPEHFKTDSSAALLADIEKTFTVIERRRIEGREAFSHTFDRNQRRDLAKGRHVVLNDGSTLLLGLADLDEHGNFADAVTLLTLAGGGPAGNNTEALLAEIDRLQREYNGDAMLRAKVDKLVTSTGDAALAAESSRTAILGEVERIRAMEEEVADLRRQQRRFSLLLGGLAVAANLAALFFLTRGVVELPLRRLTMAVKGIAEGQTVEIPYPGRRDQIGILAEALRGFRTARQRLEEEGVQRDRQKRVMEEMIAKLTETVEFLEDRAKALADNALSLRQAAQATLGRAEGVGRQAHQTAERSQRVADGAALLQKAVSAIDCRVAEQNQIAAGLLAGNAEGQNHLATLDTSLAAVATILSTLSEINDQTKVLSLNATIEAATAGAAGKGFAVVASEVKALSQKTAEATREAKERLSLIKESRRVLVVHFDKVHNQIQRQEEHSRDITTVVSEQRRVTDDISHLAGESSAISGETSNSIALVAEEAASSLKLAAEVQDAAKDISRRLGDLLEEGRSRLGGVLEVAPTAIEVAPVAIPRQKAAPPSPQNHAPLSLALPPLLAVVATNRAK